MSDLRTALERAARANRLYVDGKVTLDADVFDDLLDAASREERPDHRGMLHTFFGLEHLGDCLGTDHRPNEANDRVAFEDEEALCAKAAQWVASREERPGLDVERLAKETFLYRTSTNVPLPDDFWERQSPTMRAPFLAEARAVVAALATDTPEAET